MILAVDIGNTNISVGILTEKRVVAMFSILTPSKGARGILKLFNEIKGRYPCVKDVIMCSVVPRVSREVEVILRKRFSLKSEVIGRDVLVPIKNRYRYPNQVGQDRLVCAYAAKSLYGAPVIVIDFGTAITFDLISPKGAYEGGIIVPGIRLSSESLFQKAALLPLIDTIKAPQNLIGKDTQESILSGLFYGYGAMCQGLIASMKKKCRAFSPKVIVTGGHTALMKRFISKEIDHIDKHLVFRGMRLLKKRD